MVAMVLITWIVFREQKDESIEQIYLSDILETDEHIPTLDEIIEEHGSTTSFEEIESMYSTKVAELHSNRLLPFESELHNIEGTDDLQAIKRVYYDQTVRGISPVEPEYYIDDTQTFVKDDQVFHINPQQNALFVEEEGFQNVTDWMQAGYFEVSNQTDNLTAVEGLFKVTEDKSVTEILNLVNSLEATFNDTTVGKLLDVVDEDSVVENAGQLFEHEDLYRYRESDDQYQTIINAHQQFGYIEPQLYPYLDSDYNMDDLTVIKDTILVWRGYIDGSSDLNSSSTIELNGNSWHLVPYEGENAIPIEH